MLMKLTPGRPSSTPVNAMSALELEEQPICDDLDEWSASKENIDNFPTFSTSTTSGPTSSEASLRSFRHYVDNDGNHSSEEELEEINNKVRDNMN